MLADELRRFTDLADLGRQLHPFVAAAHLAEGLLGQLTPHDAGEHRQHLLLVGNGAGLPLCHCCPASTLRSHRVLW